MRKIMFSEEQGLHQAVLKKDKWNTRRSIPNRLVVDAMTYAGGDIAKRDEYLLAHSPFKVGEVVAIGQRYKDILEAEYLPPRLENEVIRLVEENHIGVTNKMYVKAELMPHSIRITGIKVECLQDISDEDCLAEGIIKGYDVEDGDYYTYPNCEECWSTPREAFHYLINKVCGRNTWIDNPLVYAYSFELV